MLCVIIVGKDSALIIARDFELPSLKKIAFEKQCSNIKLANFTLSKQQLGGKLANKTLSLDEKVTFLDFTKGNLTLGCRKPAERFKIAKTAAAIIIKEEKKIRSQHELFHKKSKKRNHPGKLIKSYTSDTRDVVLLTFIQMDQC